jgi:chromosome segregation ATPase
MLLSDTLVHALQTLKQRRDDLTTRNKQLRQTICAVRAEVQFLEPRTHIPLIGIYPRPHEMEKQRMHRKIDQLVNRRRHDAKRKADLQTVLQESLHNQRTEQRRIRKLQHRMFRATQDLETVVDLVHQLKSTPCQDELHAKLQQRTTSREHTIESERRVLLNQLSLLKQDYNQGQTRARNLQLGVGEKNRDIGQLEDELSHQTNVIADLENQISTVFACNMEISTEIREIRNTITIFKTEIGDDERSLHEAQELEAGTAARLSSRNTRTQTLINEVRRVGSELLQEKRSLTRHIASAKSQFQNNAESTITAKDAEIQRLRRELHEINDRHAQLVSELEKQENDQRVEADQFESVIQQLRSRSQAMKKAVTSAAISLLG